MPLAVAGLTASARGDAADPGAAVAVRAAVNRRILMFAPASARQMLAYKAAEAGIPYREIDDPTPKAAIGRDISTTKRSARAAARKMRKAA